MSKPKFGEWVTTDGGIHRRVIPYMPDMSWLGPPPTERQALRYEVTRAAVLARQNALTARGSQND